MPYGANGQEMSKTKAVAGTNVHPSAAAANADRSRRNGSYRLSQAPGTLLVYAK
jgi:hypothetical protein